LPNKKALFQLTWPGFAILILGLLAANALGDSVWKLGNQLVRSWFIGHSETPDLVTFVLLAVGLLPVYWFLQHLTRHPGVADPDPPMYLKILTFVGGDVLCVRGL
jgi:H+/Cl- antiporter ClcA